MKLDLNKFYNTNYKDFVHKEAVEEALKLVPEVELKDVEIDNILSIAFSVDEYGENPMYIEYLGKDGKTHLVRIRPAVSNEIQELLKRYVTLEQHENDKNAIYNHFETLNVPIELRSENGLDEEGNREVVLNNDNSFISLQVDPENDDGIQWLCIHNKGGLGSQSMYFVRFVDFAKVDEVPSNADFLGEIQQLEELVQRKSQENLQSSKEYADSQDDTLRAEITSNVINQINETKNDILSYVDVEFDNLKEYIDSRDAELENDMNTNFATKQELLIHLESLSEVDQQNFETLNEKINNKADKQTVDDLSQLVQEIATNVDGVEIGERTKVNFVLDNSKNEKPVNPKITSNESYYVKVGSQYIVSVFLTVEIEVIPTTTPQLLSFVWRHDLPGENPPLTLTVTLYGHRGAYTTTNAVSTNRARVPLNIPAFPATETYTDNKITIYGTAITKDLSEEAENNE